MKIVMLKSRSRQHQNRIWRITCGCSSIGRTSPCQGEGREFEPHRPLSRLIADVISLLFRRRGQAVRQESAKLSSWVQFPSSPLFITPLSLLHPYSPDKLRKPVSAIDKRKKPPPGHNRDWRNFSSPPRSSNIRSGLKGEPGRSERLVSPLNTRAVCTPAV